jgi:ATP synthase mitochondrial F1 complex assembly factor 1
VEKPEEFVKRLEKVEKLEKKTKKEEQKARDYSELMRPKKATAEAKAEIPYKKLEDIMKLDLLEGRPVAEITAIWLEYHKLKETIAAVIPTKVFEKLMSTAKKFPLFIFPIPRSQGFEFIMFQFAANTVHFTPLLCYQVSRKSLNQSIKISPEISFQVHKENAPECLNIVHYTEFKDQGIVLMRGEYDTKILTPQEAQCLANQLQLYYTQDDKRKTEILEVFTKTPEKFSHNDVIKELENLQIA